MAEEHVTFLSRPMNPWVPWVLAALCAATWLPHMLVLAHVPSYGDEGIVAYGALRVHRGEVPYRDFFEFLTPASFYWVSAFFDLLGATFFALRANVIVSAFILLAGVLEAVRRLRLRLSSAFIPAAAMAYFAGPAWLVASHHWYADAAMVWSGAFLLSDGENGSASRWRYALAGVLCALTILFLQDQGATWLLISTAALLVSGQEGRKRLWPYLAGGLAAGGSAALLLLTKVPFRELWYDLVIYPLTQYRKMPGNRGVIAAHLADGWRTVTSTWIYHDAPIDWLRILMTFATFVGTLLVHLLPVAGVAAAWYLVKKFGRSRRIEVSIALAMFLTALVTILRRPSDTGMIFALPFVLIAAVWGIDSISRAGNRRGRWFVPAWIALFGGVALGQCLLVWMSPKGVVVTPAGPVYSLLSGEQETLHGVAAFAEGHWKRGEEVFCYPYAPMFYFLFDLKNPTRHDILTYPQHTLQQMEEVRMALDVRRIRYIIWSKAVSGAEPFEAYLSRTYGVEADFKYAAILVRVPESAGGSLAPSTPSSRQQHW